VKKALITGIFGQDGSYLCELLYEKGYAVHGVTRRGHSENSEKIQKHLLSKSVSPELHYCDLYKYKEIEGVINKVRPDEIYHLAAKHFSSEMSSGENDRSLYMDNVSATFNILSAVYNHQKNTKVVIAGSCLMFDGVDVYPQSENMSYKTVSFYGLAKITENNVAVFFRNKGVFVSMAILYNHESPRRSEHFVTKKIVKNLVKIYEGKQESFELGSLDSVKDWGYAKDYAKGIWKMTQETSPMDYILATGEKRKISDFIEIAASGLGISDWRKCIILSDNLLKRNIEISLVGDASLARKNLKWENTISFKQLVSLMVRNELSGSLD